MLEHSRSAALAALCATTLALVACGGDDATGPGSSATPVAGVTVSPDTATIAVGGGVQLVATVRDASANVLSGRAIDWSSGNASVASVDSTGLVTGTGVGSATITATSEGESGTATVTVLAAPTVRRVEPATGTVGTELAIVGSGFRMGIVARLDTIDLASLELLNDTILFGFVPAEVDSGRTYAVAVENADGSQASLPSAFSVVAPTLQYVNSATKPSGNVGSTVILEGAAFADLQGSGEVLFSDGAGGTIAASIASPDDWTNTFIVTTVPSGAADGDVVVRTATGTSNALPFNVTENATFSPSQVSWTSTTPLPTGLSGHRAVFVPIESGGVQTNYAHVTGGADDSAAPVSTAYYAPINADGTLGAWTSSSALPEARAFHASVAATPFNSKVAGNGQLYVLGGIATDGGDPVTTVYHAGVNADGSLGAWVATRPLPVPLHSLGAAVFRGSIYVAGGATTGNAPVPTLYRATIDSLGELSEWEELPAMPAARAYHGLVSFGGFLYAVGGDSGTVTPDDADHTNNDTKYDQVVYARINLRTGELAQSDWTVNESAMIKRTSKHTALAAGGSLLVTAGLYSGANTGASENSFAQINADGSLGSFNGATNAVTITSQGGGNLFNHAALTYVDANGVARVMIVGGDDVNNPGTKRDGVWFY